MALAPYSARVTTTRSPGAQWERVDSEVPAPGRRVDHGDLGGVGADELGDGGIGAVDATVGLRLPARFVAADLGLTAQMAEHGVEHRRRSERGTGVVEVRDLLAAGGKGAGRGDVDPRHGRTVPASISRRS